MMSQRPRPSIHQGHRDCTVSHTVQPTTGSRSHWLTDSRIVSESASRLQALAEARTSRSALQPLFQRHCVLGRKRQEDGPPNDRTTGAMIGGRVCLDTIPSSPSSIAQVRSCCLCLACAASFHCDQGVELVYDSAASCAAGALRVCTASCTAAAWRAAWLALEAVNPTLILVLVHAPVLCTGSLLALALGPPPSAPLSGCC